MRSLASFLGMILAGLAAIAALTYPAWLLLHPYFNFPFHRLGERIGMLALLGLVVLSARRLGIADRTSLGYGPSRQEFLREASLGMLFGVVTMLMVVGLMNMLGLVEWAPTHG